MSNLEQLEQRKLEIEAKRQQEAIEKDKLEQEKQKEAIRIAEQKRLAIEAEKARNEQKAKEELNAARIREKAIAKREAEKERLKNIIANIDCSGKNRRKGPRGSTCNSSGNKDVQGCCLEEPYKTNCKWVSGQGCMNK